MKRLNSLLLVGSMLQPLVPTGAVVAAPQSGQFVIAQADQQPAGERPRPHRERGGAAAGEHGAPGRKRAPHDAAPASGEAPARKPAQRDAAPAAGEAPARKPAQRDAAPAAGEAPARKPAQRDAAPAAGEAPARKPAQRDAAPAAGEAPARKPAQRDAAPAAGEAPARKPAQRDAAPAAGDAPARKPAQRDAAPAAGEPPARRGERREGRGPDDRRLPEDRRLDDRRLPGDGRRPEDRRDRGERREGRGPDDRRLPEERRERGDREDRRDRRGAAVGAAAAGAVVGGFLAATGARRIDEIRRDRQEREEGGYRVIREPGRTIVRDRDRVFIVHDETERFRTLDPDARVERRGNEVVTFTGRRGGPQIVTITDRNGRLLRRVRRFPDGREVVIIDNGPAVAYAEEIVQLPPPPLRIPRDRYVVTTERADQRLLYETLAAPPVAPVERRYTLDQVRSSPDLRARMRSVDIDTLNFETGSWDIGQDQADRLSLIARALKQAIQRNPNEVFLVEGYTDAVGNDVDNLSLSDRRAQSVATALSQDFQVPPENLTTQGYGAKFLKVDTQEASRENRRVTLRRITPLLSAQADK